MRACSSGARIQGSKSSCGEPARRGALALCAVLLAAACTNTKLAPNLDGGGDALADGKNDARTSDIPGAADAALPPNTCAPGTPNKSKGKAESCSCDAECQTGFCVDGICCTSACTETCKACNLASSLGVCAFIPAGGKPSDPLVCPATKAATCRLDGTCDGKGACRLYVEGTECKPGTCDGDSVTGIVACDGNGNCSETSSLPCPPFTCDPATNRCAFTCTTNAQCAVGQQCVAGSCGKSANGAVCKTAADCASGFCVGANGDVRGVCCNIPCSGSCVSCNQTGSNGHCTSIPAGSPDPACQGTDRSTCSNTGLCDGKGSCTLYPQDTVCGPSVCSGLVENTPRTCDGDGNCRDPQLVDCFPFLCSNGACLENCTGNQDCAPENQCQPQTLNGATTDVCGQKQNGQPCSDSGECISGQCVDKVCCESACTGPCRSCNLASSPGHCLNVASAAPDPRSTCKDLGATSCSTNGVCDGNGACQAYPTGTVCAKQTCLSGLHTPASTCNASGQCVPPPSIPCNPYVCNGDTCYGSCTSSNIQCASGNVCTITSSSSSCGLKSSGQDCSAGTECKSGFCAQGVCCNSACLDACMACNLTATPGLCLAVADNAPDPQRICVANPPNTCGTTGNCARGACSYSTANCKPSICANTSSVTPAATCDGKGACITPSDQPCGSFACVAGACKTTCTVATQAQDCLAPNTCVTISGVLTCGLKVDGAPCTSSAQCQTGFCTEGVCCNNACSDDQTTGGLCKTCLGSGTTGTTAAGTCHNVPSDGSDPKSRCANSKSDPTKQNCSNAGTCDGNGACKPWPTSTACRPQSCPAGGDTFTRQIFCDGKGACPTVTANDQSACDPYMCGSGSACLTTCQTISDCMTPNACVTVPNHHCGDTLPKGAACTLGTDCASGHCVDGVCCNSACADGCQSCTLSSSLGTCSNIGSGSPPRVTSPLTCPAAQGTGVCGNTGNCNGSDACEQHTTCTPTTCATATSEYTMCTTNATTSTCTASTQACGTGYLCVSGKCATTPCTTSSSCDTTNGYSCIGGSCRKEDLGASCTDDKQCSSAHCADGVCCNTACSGCSGCTNSLTGKTTGQCQAVTAGTDAHNACAASGTPCGLDGNCDGTGLCRMPASGTACGSSCTGSTLTPISCDGAGNCNVYGTGAPCPNSTVCGSSTICGNLKVLGATCQAAADCASNNCVDGHCCGTASCGTCQACTGANGTCVTVASSDDDTCNGTKTCDAAGACKNKSGQACTEAGDCASNSCVDGHCCGTPSCGTCQACTGAGGTCVTVASSDDDTCNGTKTCDAAGACLNKTGQPCVDGTECASGSCVGGFCT